MNIFTLYTSPHRISSRLLLPLLLFFLDLAFAQQSISSHDDDDPDLGTHNVSPSMAIIIIVLILTFFIAGTISIYIRKCSMSSSSPIVIPSHARSMRIPHGLDQPMIEATFPTFLYSTLKDFKIHKAGSLECAICLNEFQQHDTLRLLPKCNHVFHSGCIDGWLVGHITCPVCRSNLLHLPTESTHQVNTPTDLVIPSQSVQIPFARDANSPRTVNLTKKFPRSHSTGHSLMIQQPGDDNERLTLRIPAEVRRQLFERSSKLKRTTSMMVLPRASSSRRGYRANDEGSGSSRYGRLFGRSGFGPFGFGLGSFRMMTKVGSEGEGTGESTWTRSKPEDLPPFLV